MNIQKTYNTIAKDFSATRTQPWGEFDEFAKHFPKSEFSALDIGCGNGRLYNYLKEFDLNYIGVDLSENLLEEARKKHPEALFIHESMTELESVKNKKFDVIFFIASFHHLGSKNGRVKTLEKVKKLLKKDGIICMTNWNLFQKKYKKYVWKAAFKSLISRFAWNDTFIPFTKNDQTTWRYYHAFTPKELHNLFAKTGLEIVDEFFYQKDKQIDNWKECRNICHVLKQK